MRPFCATHRPIAIDVEGMGQSFWPSAEKDIPEGESREFMADMELTLLEKLGASLLASFTLECTDDALFALECRSRALQPRCQRLRLLVESAYDPREERAGKVPRAALPEDAVLGGCRGPLTNPASSALPHR